MDTDYKKYFSCYEKFRQTHTAKLSIPTAEVNHSGSCSLPCTEKGLELQASAVPS
ncbi:MAG: hypothetical protein H7A23_26900 [Leptospiraceae bacterium]|nr:hypothetical protein [Leptospiraceae bacterium]